MSYLRPLSLQPASLRQSAMDSWLQHVLTLIRESNLVARTLATSPMTPDDSKQIFVWKGVEVQPKTLEDYMKTFLPLNYQEECFHRGAQILRKELVLFDFFPLYFGLLWKAEFRHLDIPPIADGEDRVAVLDNLARNLACVEQKTESARLRLFETSDISIEESYLMKRILRGFGNLNSLVLWWAADDQMLNIIGSTCHHLESIDVWRSSGVTDLGVKMLLLANDDELDFDLRGDSRLCSSLKRLGVKETSVTHIGCLAAIIRCHKLEVLNFSHTSIVKEFFAEVQNLNRIDWGKSYSLKSLFYPVTDGVTFREVVRAFPELVDLRIWTTNSRIPGVTSRDLPNLHSLLLGGLHYFNVFKDLSSAIGHQLTTLKLETVLADIHLDSIGKSCPNLVELQIVNGRIVVRDHSCQSASKDYFANLKLIYLFLVQYITDSTSDENAIPNGPSSMNQVPPPSALHCLLFHSKAIEGLQATGCPLFDDSALKYVMSVNNMSKLKRFIMTDATNITDQPAGTSVTLTSASVNMLFNSCPSLTCIGDLRHWHISPKERRELTKSIQQKTGIKWISTACH